MQLDDALRPKDRIGRQQPHRLRFVNFMAAMPWIAGVFTREVPASRVSFKDIRATVECPCGERPEMDAGNMKRCECGRYFLHTGRTVKVAFSPQA